MPSLRYFSYFCIRASPEAPGDAARVVFKHFPYMDNNDKKQPGGLNISPETARGHYSNLAVISHTAGEFTFDFASMLPGMPAPEVQSRIILTPSNAKSVLLTLQENINKYESQFGRIELPGGPKGTLNLADLGNLGGSKS